MPRSRLLSAYTETQASKEQGYRLLRTFEPPSTACACLSELCGAVPRATACRGTQEVRFPSLRSKSRPLLESTNSTAAASFAKRRGGDGGRGLRVSPVSGPLEGERGTTSDQATTALSYPGSFNVLPTEPATPAGLPSHRHGFGYGHFGWIILDLPRWLRRSARFFRFFFSWGVCFGGRPTAYFFFFFFSRSDLDSRRWGRACVLLLCTSGSRGSHLSCWSLDDGLFGRGRREGGVSFLAQGAIYRLPLFPACLLPRSFFVADAFFFDRSMSSGRYKSATGCPFRSDGFGVWRRSLAGWERSLGKPVDLCYCFRKFGDPVKLVGSKVRRSSIHSTNFPAASACTEVLM